MKEGVLWRGDAEKSLTQNIQHAARHYKQAYGYWPDTCHVHPDELTTPEGFAIKKFGKVQIGPADAKLAVTVVESMRVAVRHVWIGRVVPIAAS